MTAIVTGGAGFIGSHLVDLLAARGERVIVIDDLRNHASRLSPAYARRWGNLGHSVQWRYYSVQDYFPEYEVDVIYHLAGPVGPVGVLPLAGRIALDMALDSDAVRRWALATGAVLVDVSTSEVYGSPDDANGEDDRCVFGAETSARSEYAIAKLAAERMLLNTADLDVRIVRPFNVAGPRQRPEGGFVLPRFIRQALAGEPLTVYQPGTQRRAFTHVLDIVDGIVAAAERGKRGGVYNLGNPDNECSIMELAQEVLWQTGGPSGIDIVDPVDLWGPAFREAPDKIPDPRRAIAELGWSPSMTRASVIRDALHDILPDKAIAA